MRLNDWLLRVDPGSRADDEEAAGLTRRLRRELLELDVSTV
jgi:hypothetical protein